MDKKIFSLTELKEQGKKIGRLSLNRRLNPSIVKSKKKSIKENGLLMPAVIVDAKDVKDLEVVDFETGEKVDSDNYIVLLDANHRYAAYLELKEKDKYDGEFYFIYSLNPSLSIQKQLSEINIATNPWKGADYVKGALMDGNQSNLMKKMGELANDGYSLSAASKWLTFSEIKKEKLVAIMKGKTDAIAANDTDVDNRMKLLKTTRAKLGDKLTKGKAVIDWIISKYNSKSDKDRPTFIDDMIGKINSLTDEDCKEIQSFKGERGIKSKQDKINEFLTEKIDQKIN